MEQTQRKQISANARQIILVFAMCISALSSALFFRFGMAIVGTLLLAVMGGIFAVVFLTARSPVSMVLGVTISVMALQLLEGFSASLMGVSALVAALVLAYQVKKHETKTTVLVTAAAILGIGFTVAAAIVYAFDGGSLVPSELLAEYHAFFKEMKLLLTDEVKAMVDTLDESTLALYAQMDVTKEMLYESYIDTVNAAVDLLELMLPGLAMLIFQFLAYLEISAFRIAARAVHVEAVLPAPRWYLIPTQISCIVYIAVASIYILVSFFAAEDSVLMVVLVNLWLALLPTMLLCGFRVMLLRLGHPMHRARTSMVIFIFIFGFVFLTAVALRLALFVLSFLGAQTISTMHVMESEKNKKT